jgi:hypothetical protein
MAHEDDLLLRLRRYVPTEGRDPLEDFVTEAFGWLLSSQPALSDALLARLGLEEEGGGPARWATQVRTRAGVIDMVCRTQGQVVVFEHKTYSSLHDDQLLRYRAWGDRQAGGGCLVVLITPSARGASERADVHLTWAEVYALLEGAELGEDMGRRMFLRLLREEGFGPPAPVSHESLLTYLPSATLEASLDALMERALELDWSRAYELVGRPRGEREPYRRPSRGAPRIKEGRVGVDLYRSWRPGVFLGVMLDGSDHKVEPSQPSRGPDMCLVLDLSNNPDFATGRQAYLASAGYLDMLERVLADERSGYDVVDHLATHTRPNPWHVLHVRRPLSEVLAGTRTSDEQLTRFHEHALAMVEFVFPPEG